jgi:uncharacterized protein
VVMSRIRFVLVVLILVSAPVLAEEPDLVSSHNSAAQELLTMLHVDTTMNETINIMLKAQPQQNPQLAEVEDILRAFLAKYVSYEAMRPDLIRMYTDAFTESDLREMIAPTQGASV